MCRAPDTYWVFGEPYVLFPPSLVLSPLRQGRDKVVLVVIEGERMLADQEQRTRDSGPWGWREPKCWQKPYHKNVPTGSASLWNMVPPPSHGFR